MRVTLYTPILDRPMFHEVIAELVQRQTHPIHEHLVVEEGWSYGKHQQPIADARYILRGEQHISIGCKSNLAHLEATGDLILSWSSDDYFEKDYVERQVAIFESNPGVHVVGFSTQRMYDLPNQRYRIYRKGNNGGNFAYRRNYFDAPPFTDSSYGEDVAFFQSIPRRDLVTTDALENSFVAIRHKVNGHGGHACPMKPTGSHDDTGRIFRRWFTAPKARQLYERIMRTPQ